VKPLKQEE